MQYLSFPPAVPNKQSTSSSLLSPSDEKEQSQEQRVNLNKTKKEASTKSQTKPDKSQLETAARTNMPNQKVEAVSTRL
jgi:hypothetical protein